MDKKIEHPACPATAVAKSGVIEIKFAGYGGQGIIRSGIIVGRAASIYDNKFATMNQSFGPEARGGACSSELVVSSEKILYPYVTNSDILIAMSQGAYDKFEPELKEDGMLLYDIDLVKIKQGRLEHVLQPTLYPIPATRFAEELGQRIIANIVMLGFFTAITKVVSKESMEKTIPESVPSKSVEINLKAFNKGFEYYQVPV